jgi:hypothetical protein
MTKAFKWTLDKVWEKFRTDREGDTGATEKDGVTGHKLVFTLKCIRERVQGVREEVQAGHRGVQHPTSRKTGGVGLSAERTRRSRPSHALEANLEKARKSWSTVPVPSSASVRASTKFITRSCMPASQHAYRRPLRSLDDLDDEH